MSLKREKEENKKRIRKKTVKIKRNVQKSKQNLRVNEGPASEDLLAARLDLAPPVVIRQHPLPHIA